MAASKTHKEIMNHLRDSGYSDGMIVLEMQKLLPGGATPSLNSVRRWRYGEATATNTYAVVLEIVYKDAQTRGLLK